MTSRCVLILSATLLLFSGAGCRPMKREAARTQGQLERLARDTGTDHTLDAVADSYHRNVAPMVSEAQRVFGQYEAVQQAEEVGQQMSEKVAEFSSSIAQSAENAFRSFPQSEQELERAIDHYNRDFAAWLKENFQSLQLAQGSRHAHSHPLDGRARLRGRPAPHR